MHFILLHFGNNLIKMQFTCHVIHPVRVYSFLEFSILTLVQSSLSLILVHFIIQERNSPPIRSHCYKYQHLKETLVHCIIFFTCGHFSLLFNFSNYFFFTFFLFSVISLIAFQHPMLSGILPLLEFSFIR